MTESDELLQACFRGVLHESERHQKTVHSVDAAYDWVTTALGGSTPISLTRPEANIQRTQITNLLSIFNTVSAALRLRRNQLAPIASLPDDVLGLIFHAFASHEWIKYSAGPFMLKWTKVMLVCRAWHRVALTQAPLWSFLKLQAHDRAGRLRRQLELSKAYPLSVEIEYGNVIWRVKAFIAPHTHRIRSLDLHIVEDIQEVIQEFAGHPWPILDTLKLDSSEGLGDMEFPAFWLNLSTLRVLSVVKGRFLLSQFKGLTELKVRRTPEDHLPYDDLLAALGNMPELKALDLVWCLPEEVPDHIVDAPIRLPHLSFIALNGQPQVITKFLASLSFALGCYLSLVPFDITDVPEDDSLGDNIFGYLRNHFQLANGTKPVRSIQINSLDGLTLNAVTDLSLVEFFNLDTDVIALHMGTIAEVAHWDTTHNLLPRLLRSLCPDFTTQLDARLEYYFTASAWAKCFASLPALDTIYITVDQPSGLNCIEFLLRRLGGAKPVRRRPATFPGIQNIHIRDTTTFRETTEEAEERKSRMEASMTALVQLFTVYKELGRIVTLHTPERDVGYMTTDRLRSLSEAGARISQNARIWDQAQFDRMVLKRRKMTEEYERTGEFGDWVSDSD